MAAACQALAARRPQPACLAAVLSALRPAAPSSQCLLVRAAVGALRTPLRTARALHSEAAFQSAEIEPLGGERSTLSAAPKKADLIRPAGAPRRPARPRGGTTTAVAGEFVRPELAPDKVIRCTAFCTAEEYDLTKLLAHLPRRYAALPVAGGDVCRLRLPRKRAGGRGAESDDAAAGDVFVFRSGTAVSWGATASETNALLTFIREAPGVEIEPHSSCELHNCDYIADPNSPTGSRDDTTVLDSTILSASAMLAFSQGLAWSVKLSVLESDLNRYLADDRHVSAALMGRRKLPLPLADVLRRQGALLSFRQRLNTNHTGCFLGTPDFRWSRLRLRNFYNAATNTFDIRSRVSALNKKLDHVNERTRAVGRHLGGLHETKLVWIIIMLIAICVAFDLFHVVDRVGYLDFLPVSGTCLTDSLQSGPDREPDLPDRATLPRKGLPD